MKTKLGAIFGTVAMLLWSTNCATAQAPSSVLGDGFLVGIAGGSYPFASYGYYVFLPANSGNTYQSVGIYNVASSSGTYSYMATGSSTAILNITDSILGLGAVSANFATFDSGSFYTTANSFPGTYQTGNFDFASMNAPSLMVSKSFVATIYDGLYPFGYRGSFTFRAAASGNTYTIVGDGICVANSSGTYIYSLANRSTGKLVINDVLVGTATVYVGFTSPSNGGYAITQPTTGGFQIGNLVFLDTTPPTVTITAPTAAQRWSNSVFTVTGQASDDVQVAQVYYQLSGQGWNLATTANAWANWSRNITLTTPGTNTIQAYSVDTSGNSSPISSQNLVYVLTSSIAVQTNGNGTVSPNYNGQILEIGKSYSMTATAASGFTFTNWTGSVRTNGSTVSFIMASNLVLTANFVDTQRPTVWITNPATAKVFTNSQTVTISATASDNVAVTNVTFYDGSTPRGNDTAIPYSYDWAFTVADNGAHIWTARAYDAAGNIATSQPVTLTVSIDLTPPAVSIFAPTNGQVYPAAAITVAGTAADLGSPATGIATVEVRTNGGAWLLATGTTSWTRAVTLSPCANLIDVRSRDGAGNYSAVVSVAVTYTPPDNPPSVPINLSPTNGASDVTVMPTLQAGAFSDLDCTGDTHAASRWQVLNGPGAVIVWDSGTNSVDKSSIVVPSGKLAYASNYLWKVRYEDSRGAWSAYSATTGFRTILPALHGTRQGTNLFLQWPTNALGFTLQSVTNLAATNWGAATPTPVVVTGQYTVTNAIGGSNRFYRLKRP